MSDFTDFAQSESINELAKALAAYLNEAVDPKQDAKNDHFNNDYTTITSVLKVVRQPLAKHNLSVIQGLGGTAERPRVTTQVMHTSGQWIRGTCEMEPQKRTPQGVGSTYTYMRRYALKAMLSLADHDDDGNDGSDGNGKNGNAKGVKGLEEKLDNGLISDEQKNKLYDLAAENKRTKAQMKGILKHFGFESSEEITKDKFDAICKQVGAEGVFAKEG